MGTPLRAFLMSRAAGSDWTIEVFRDLESLVRAWEMRPASDKVTGVVHVGFERPPARLFDELATQFEARVLLTASAKYSLPGAYRSSSATVGEIEGLPIYLAISGWGYEAPDIAAQKSIVSAVQFRGWVEQYVAGAPDKQNSLLEAGIFDDESYLVHEYRLDRSSRTALGEFRFNALIGDNDGDPCTIAKVAPPWLRERLFADLEMTNRLYNVFERENIILVSDLDGYSAENLMSLANFGRTCARDLTSALAVALSAGPPQTLEEGQLTGGVLGGELQETALVNEMRGALSDFMPRDRDIISRRMGLNGPQRTLAEIGLSYDISRERIRQIEAKIVAQFFERGLWHKRLLNKLAKLLEGREFPLPLLGIEAADSWYAGIDQIPDAIQYILEHSPNNDIETVKIDHLVFIGNINQERWEDSVSEARRLIASGLQDNWSEEHCKTVVSALIPQSACEFRELLWDKAATEAHFSANESGFKVLTSFGRGVEHIVQAVLQDAERPLHFTEIAIRASERAKREIDARRAHNAAGAVGNLARPRNVRSDKAPAPSSRRNGSARLRG